MENTNSRQERLEDLLKRLGTSQGGLSLAEVAARQGRSAGEAELAAVQFRTKVVNFFRTVANPIAAILVVASAVAAFLGQEADALIILTMVLLSSLINFWQTYRSEKAMKELKASVAPTATVLRDGHWQEIARHEVVVGDLVRLSSGDLVPADARLIEANDLHLQQAALTGESLPAEKYVIHEELHAITPESPTLVFLGSSVVSGTGKAVIFAVGRQTSFGDIAARLAERPPETEFERGMRRFGMLILQTVLFLVLFILVVNIGFGRDALESLLFSVALAVGLAPEFLPMITTITLSKGAQVMAKQKVIVKHLSAIENLGSIDVLCSDKTGTLTTGVTALENSIAPLGPPSDLALYWARLNSQFETGIKSPLDKAILEKSPGMSDGFVKTDEIPFDFNRRRVSVVVAKNHSFTLITKGAPENVIGVCSSYEGVAGKSLLDEAARARILALFADLSGKGYRVLAVAIKDVSKEAGFKAADECDLHFVGFLIFADQLLEGIGESIRALQRDGVSVKILTGDNELVTKHLCAQVGLPAAEIVLGRDLENMGEMALAHVAEKHNIFARVSPAQKHRLISALKARNHVVGFLGDGINDAPSLHAADVGISVAGAVDVAREASDIILLDRHLDVLHAGILAGRQAFGNVFKYMLMGTSSNFGNMFSMAAATLVLPFLPMLPTQILLNNFLYDLAQITIPTDNIDPMYTRSPQRWNIAFVRRFMMLIGPLSSLFDFLTFYILLRWFHYDEKAFHTGWFVESLATQTLVLFIIRSAGRPWKDRPSLALTLTTLGVVLVGLLLPHFEFARVLGFTPLPAAFYLYLVVATGAYLVLVEVVKSRAFKKFAL